MQQVIFMATVQVPFTAEAQAGGAAETLARFVARSFGYQDVRATVTPVVVQAPPADTPQAGEEALEVAPVPPDGTPV